MLSKTLKHLGWQEKKQRKIMLKLQTNYFKKKIFQSPLLSPISLRFTWHYLTVQIMERGGENWGTNSSIFCILASVSLASNYFHHRNRITTVIIWCMVQWKLFDLPENSISSKSMQTSKWSFKKCTLCKPKSVRSVSGVSITTTSSTRVLRGYNKVSVTSGDSDERNSNFLCYSVDREWKDASNNPKSTEEFYYMQKIIIFLIIRKRDLFSAFCPWHLLPRPEAGSVPGFREHLKGECK